MKISKRNDKMLNLSKLKIMYINIITNKEWKIPNETKKCYF